MDFQFGLREFGYALDNFEGAGDVFLFLGQGFKPSTGSGQFCLKQIPPTGLTLESGLDGVEFAHNWTFPR
jgi:hypothetical protein